MNKGTPFFIECYLTYRLEIYNIIFSKLRDRHSSEDLSQEVFFRFYINLSKIRSESARRWLISTAKNILREYYRSLERIPEDISEAQKVEDEILSYAPPDHDIRIIFEDIKQSLQELDRLIFDYVIFRDHTYEETAVFFGLNKRHIRYRMMLIHKYITAYFAKRGIKNLSELLNFFISLKFFLSLMSL